MLDYSDPTTYQAKTTSPRKFDYTKYYVYQKGECVLTDSTLEELEDFARSLGDWNESTHVINYIKTSNYIVEKSIDLEAFNKARMQHQVAGRDAYDEWIEALCDHYEVNIIDDPVIIILFERAWSEGHGMGYKEVDSKFEDYLDMLTKIIECGKQSIHLKQAGLVARSY